MATVQTVDDEQSAAALADLLNGNDRTRPVVVATSPQGRAEPWIDVEQIAHDVGDLADVYLMPTGAFTWEFSRRMAEGTQVYGGAGRVYPVGHEWTTDRRLSPLRFAFDARDAGRATENLVSDALRMAVAAGLLASAPTQHLRHVRGTVQGVIAGRALVDVGTVFFASVAAELTVDGVPAERLFTPGQSLEGGYDPATNRIDVRTSVRAPADALGAYAAGDVVLARVAAVGEDTAELLLFPATSAPAVTVRVTKQQVTGNDRDDLRSLLTQDEVVAARVTAVGPGWALDLSDVDDDEPVTAAPALLPGGPPWLTEEDQAGLDAVGHPEVVEPAPGPTSQPPTAPPGPEPVVAQVEVPAAPAPARPKPSMFDPHRRHADAAPAQPGAAASPAPEVPRPTPTPGPKPGPGPRPAVAVTTAAPAPEPAVKATTRDLLLQIETLKARVRALEAETEGTTEQVRQLQEIAADAEQRAVKAERAETAAKARLRKARAVGKQKSVEPVEAPTFADRERGFRHLVEARWATRISPGEQAARPLVNYAIGPDFLRTLDEVEGVDDVKVADVVVEVVTGLAQELPGRELHRMRTGTGGSDPVRTREDGAVCWRAALQINTPSARRLHYWQLPAGEIELSSVRKHDDFAA